MQTVLLHSVEVRRELHMNTLAVRLLLKVPIIWMTGYYSLKNAKVFHFIPAGGDGNFNVDLKYVSIEVVATIKAAKEFFDIYGAITNKDTTNSTTAAPSLISNINGSTPNNIEKIENKKLVCLDVFEIGIHWRKASFKFDGLWKGFNHLTDFSLNQVILKL